LYANLVFAPSYLRGENSSGCGANVIIITHEFLVIRRRSLG
jgi:hypothetical protein